MFFLFPTYRLGDLNNPLNFSLHGAGISATHITQTVLACRRWQKWLCSWFQKCNVDPAGGLAVCWWLGKKLRCGGYLRGDGAAGLAWESGSLHHPVLVWPQWQPWGHRSSQCLQGDSSIWCSQTRSTVLQQPGTASCSAASLMWVMAWGKRGTSPNLVHSLELTEFAHCSWIRGKLWDSSLLCCCLVKMDFYFCFNDRWW